MDYEPLELVAGMAFLRMQKDQCKDKTESDLFTGYLLIPKITRSLDK